LNPVRSLAVRLTLAFVLVGVTGIIIVSFAVRFYTQREFNKLVLDQNQQMLLTSLERFYEVTGSWDGVETVFRPQGLEDLLQNRPLESRFEQRRALFVIASAGGKIVFGDIPNLKDSTLSTRQLRQGIAIQSKGKTVGWLIFTPTLSRWSPGTPEGDFLVGVQRAILVSTLGATGIALILGGVLAYTMTRTLRELTAATQELSQGHLGLQVEVRSQDELGQLAHSFNQMSSDMAHSVELRRKMTADIAHDLRTPLSVILGYTEALSDGKLQPDEEMYKVMHTEAEHLSHLIDDLKVLSLADAGELPLSPQPVQPGKLVIRAAEAYRVQAEARQIELRTQIEPDLPEIEADVERMAQVMGNLVSNALRFTDPNGRILLTAGLQEGMAVITVADDGAGIAQEDLPFIFERSFRGDKARQQSGGQQSGESGLGLAIARSLIELQGGQIQVESTLGQGTTFTIRLPVLPKSA